MCLLVIAYRQDTEVPLIVAGNRDEFHARPASPADWWNDPADTLGGRDLEAGGTWLAMHRAGRFAAVTNYHDAEPVRDARRSRGHLVTDFVAGRLAPLDYLDSLDGSLYAGFNLLLFDGDTLAYGSNRGSRSILLEPGLYGLSNALLDTPWAKVERSKSRLGKLLAAGSPDADALLDLLDDREPGPVEEARQRHLPLPTAHAITAPFIVLPDYGTRCSTVVRATASNDWEFVERRFDPAGSVTGESRYSVAIGKD